MGATRAVPSHLRIGLPVLVAANVALLAVSNICKGASTQVDGHAPLGLLKPHAASDDNLFSAVGRLAEAKVWFMVIIVAGLSGLWPYVKLLATLGVVTLTDTGRLSQEGAHTGLCVLEVLGKYSFADVVLICFNTVIFEISTGGVYRILSFGQLEINLYMHLKFGSIALIIGVTMSTLLTHWAAWELSHNAPPRKTPPAIEEEQRPLLREEMRSTKGTSMFLAVAGIMAASIGLILHVVGSGIPAVEVIRSGFLGKLIRPQNEQDLHISVFSMTERMMHSGGLRDDNAIRFFAVLFIFLVFVAPLLEFVFLLFSSLASLLPAARKTWPGRFEACAAWLSSFGVVDVYLIVCLAVIFEIKTVVDFNIGDECAPFSALMDNPLVLRIAGLAFAASSSCFDPIPSIEKGWYILLVSILVRTAAWRCISWMPKEETAAVSHEA